MNIRDGRLYKEEFPTFELYCKQRWGISRTYAWRVIGAAERINLLSPHDQSRWPSSEFQMRPFLKLKPEVFPTAWKKVLSSVQSGEITSAIIGRVIEELVGKSQSPSTRPIRRIILPTGKVGEILALLGIIKHHIDSDHLDSAKSDLDRIDRLILPTGNGNEAQHQRKQRGAIS